MKSKYFVPKFVLTALKRDSDRYAQTTLQAQASAAVSEREYLARYSVTAEYVVEDSSNG